MLQNISKDIQENIRNNKIMTKYTNMKQLLATNIKNMYNI